MYQLLETIKLNHGRAENLFYHRRRMANALIECYGSANEVRLEELLQIPEEHRTGICRCRILYKQTIDRIEFSSFRPRSFNRLKLVHDDSIDYHLKYADRSLFDMLLSKKEDADEIIIVRKGLITDCTIGNLVFFDGTNWFTPDSPLLMGTQRQALLDRGLIGEKRISEKDLPRFEKAGIINAFYDLASMPVVPVGHLS